MNKLTQIMTEITVSYNPGPELMDRPIIKSSSDAHDIFRSIWDENSIALYEELKVLYFDRKNGIIGYRNLNRGCATGTAVDIQLLFAIALKCKAVGIMIAHNHPSGQLMPSNADKELTKKINEISKLFSIRLLDHIILTPESFYSFCDEFII